MSSDSIARTSGARNTGILIVALIAITLAFDLVAPLGLAAGVPYVLPAWVAARLGSRRMTQITVATCITLIFLGMIASPAAGGAEHWKVIGNRLMAVFAVVVACGTDWWLPARPTTHRLRFPVLAYLAPLLSFLVAIACSWVFMQVFQETSAAMRERVAVLSLQEKLLRHDDMLTMSARMGAATGDGAWQARYDEQALQCQRVLNELRTRSGPLGVTQDLIANEPERPSARIERQALRIAAGGDLLTATSLLSGEAYNQSKLDDAAEMNRFLNEFEAVQRARKDAASERTTAFAVTAVVASLFCLGLWFFMLRGISSWREAEAQYQQGLEEANDELRRANRDLENFVYVASHDLRSPLRAIDNLAQWVREDADDLLPQESREHINKMQQRVSRMDRLLDDLLRYHRAGLQQDDAESVDARELVEGVVDLIQVPDGMRVGIDGAFPRFATLRTPLTMCLQNLIDNAIKHHDRKEGYVRVTCSESPEFVTFRVEDDGPGIPAAFQERIFGLFQTLERKDSREASGMGLPLIRRATESHGGSISVESEGERGTVFHLRWPRVISIGPDSGRQVESPTLVC